jgi:hypothetical protein
MAAPNVKDAELIETKALPGSATTVYSDGIDLGALSQNGQRVAPVEFELVAPAVTTGELPDAQTLIYKVQTDDDSAFGSATEEIPALITQTGAAGAGAVTASKRFRLRTNGERYVRVGCTKSGAGSAATASMTLRLLF